MHIGQSLHALPSPLGEATVMEETAGAFRTSWDNVFDAVEHVVTWVWNTERSARSTVSPSMKFRIPSGTNISPWSTRSIWVLPAFSG